MARSKSKFLDLFLIILFPALAFGLTLYLKLNFFQATLLFFAVPSAYLSFRKPHLIKRSLIFTGIVFIPMVIILDYFAYTDLAWFVPNSAIRFFNGAIPIEDFIWTFFYMYFGVIFWEYFVDHSRTHKKTSKHLKYLVIVLSLLLSIFLFVYFGRPELLVQPYTYLKLGIIFIASPLIILLFEFPRLIRKVCIIGIYFFMVSLLEGYAGLKLNHWNFPGHNFIGLTKLAG
ncbi:MAG: hypothetical protein A2758_03130 [Candidatus Zambryskibacteria bacterium RIFCSPHIGHO2_01_FULL_49_18]|uniref:Lycopene cyclase domain-containing protein n=1 Tax=Candidatus Zambryskibacteria bacterium RIFCSPHIGHO2_01_FULL_49_18 TaxID=1802740 RepID=A0A1G2T3E2_9BACT|nr:MAG: hypothetical protein A2758_03130 [Candidatus Zambryskibacteria bacterium RIFCSPHIGHO2_01_FULL_49_18]